MPSGSTLVDRVSAAYPALGEFYAADWAALEARDEGLYVCSGGAVTASATVGLCDVAACVDFVGTTEMSIIAQTVSGTLNKNITTTVAAGSNGVHTNTFAGAGSIVVAATAGWNATGQFAVIHAGVIQTVVSYGSITDGTHLGGCSLVTGWSDYVLATGDTIQQVNNDLTNPRWALVEMDNTGTINLNLGTAAAAPQKPTLNTNRVLHASILLLPTTSNTTALQMDALLTNTNSKSKIQEGRRLVNVHNSRLLTVDTTNTSLSNPTGLASLLGATYTLPANSLKANDVLVVEASGRLVLPTGGANSAVQFELLLGTGVLVNYTSLVLTKDTGANGRQWVFRAVITIRTSAIIDRSAWCLISPPSATITELDLGNLSGLTTTGAGGVGGGLIAAGIDNTTAQALDFQARFVTSSTGSSITLRHFSVEKRPS